MSPQGDTAITLPQPRSWAQMKIGGWLGYMGIWAFFCVFLIYPLIHLFYDAFTTPDGAFSLNNFYDFFTDAY